MSALMRAKLQVQSVEKPYEGAEEIKMAPVCDSPFGAEGQSEDNTFARYTPSGALSLTITNPDLVGKFKVGQTFYVDFTETGS